MYLIWMKNLPVGRKATQLFTSILVPRDSMLRDPVKYQQQKSYYKYIHNATKSSLNTKHFLEIYFVFLLQHV